jgi:flagellar biosynthetic protein FliR
VTDAALLEALVPRAVLLALALARVGGLLALAPVIGSRLAPLRVRAALALFLALAMLPLLPLEHGVALAGARGAFGLGAALAREAAIGLAIGLGAQLVLGGVQMAGQLAGIQMGLGLSNLVDPQSGEQLTSLAQWTNLLALLVFLAVDGDHVLIRAVAESFTLVPVGGGLPAAAGLGLVLTLAGGLFVVALKVAAPVLVLVLLVNAAMGVLAKVIPQLNVFIVGFPLNVATGLFAFGAALPSTVHVLARAYGDLAASLAAVLRALD